MKELIEKLKNYNRWRRGDEAVPMPHPQEVGEMIDQAIKAIEDYLKTQGGRKMKKGTLKILNTLLSLKAEGWTDVREMLKEVQIMCRCHELEWVEVEYKGFTMLVEPDSDIELQAAKFEEWKKRKVQEGLPDILWIPFDEIRPYFE